VGQCLPGLVNEFALYSLYTYAIMCLSPHVCNDVSVPAQNWRRPLCVGVYSRFCECECIVHLYTPV